MRLKGGPNLKETKDRLRPFSSSFTGQQITIIRFKPPSKVKDPIKLASYEAARFSTEHKVKTFAFLGCNVKDLYLDYSISGDEFRELLAEANNTSVGVIVQNPFPKDFKKELSAISYEKDIDGLRENNPFFPVSATSETIFRLVEPFVQDNDVVAVVGAKGFVGGGVSKLLKERGITTLDLDYGDDLAQTRKANIVVSATGVPELMDERHIIPEHRLVVDAGFIPLADSKILGDVNRSAYDIPQNIAPVPGGVGPFQMATLMERLVAVTCDREFEPWTIQAPETTPSIKGDQLTPSNIETILDVADYLIGEYGVESDNSSRYMDENHIWEITGEKLNIASQDGRGTIFTEQEGEIYSHLEIKDIRSFESYEQEFFPSRYEGEIDIEDEGWEL